MGGFVSKSCSSRSQKALTEKEKALCSSASSSENLNYFEKDSKTTLSVKKQRDDEPSTCKFRCTIHLRVPGHAESRKDIIQEPEEVKYTLEGIIEKLASLNKEQVSLIKTIIPKAKDEYDLILNYCKHLDSNDRALYPKKPCGPNRKPNVMGSCAICAEYDRKMKNSCAMYNASRAASRAIDRHFFRLVDIQTEMKMLNHMKTLYSIVEYPHKNTHFKISRCVWVEKCNGYQLDIKGRSRKGGNCKFSIQPPKLVLQQVVEPRMCWPFAQSDFARDRTGERVRYGEWYAKWFERWTIVADAAYPDLVFRK